MKQTFLLPCSPCPYLQEAAQIIECKDAIGKAICEWQQSVQLISELI